MMCEGWKLHVGCGTRKLDSYVNIDVREDVAPDLVLGADAIGLHYSGQRISEIYACHVIEHFTHPFEVVQEWGDALEYHGVLRLAVPHMANICEAVSKHNVHLERVSGLIWGRHDYPENVHHHGWTFEGLANMLREAGFYGVKQWNPHHIFPDGYHDFSYAELYTASGIRLPMSLNVEAKKI